MSQYYLKGDVAARFDSDVGAGAGIYFERQLEQVEGQALRYKNPELNGLALFALKTDVDPGAESYKRRIYEHTGQAMIISDYADDLPRVDVAATEDMIGFKNLGAAFGYNIQDLRAAEYARRLNNGASVYLPTEKAMAARRAIDAAHDDIIWNGAPAAGLFGVLNHPHVPRYPMDVASTAATDTVYDALCRLFDKVKENSTEVERPNRLLLASKVYNLLSKKLRTNTDSTALDLLAKSVGIARESIISVHELNGKGLGGNDAVIADRKDPLVMSYVMPVLYQQLPVERKGLEYVVSCLGRSGGVMSTYPLGMVIGSFTNALA